MLALLWLTLAYVMAIFLHLGPLAVIPLWIAGWCFVVWTVAVGVRAGLRGGQ